MLIPFARQSKISDQGYSGERLVNYFLRPSDGVSEAVLIGASGVRSISDLGAPVRAIVNHASVIFAVAGGYLWRIGNGGVSTKVGAVIDSAETVMVSSGSQIAITSGEKYYLYNGIVTQEFATGAVSKPVGVAYQDGFFIVIGSSGGRDDGIVVSELDNGKVFNGLDFAFAESAPDALRAIISDHGELWLFGSSSVEVFYNVGNADFPFAPNRGAVVEHGCMIGKSVAKSDNSVFWVGDDGVVYRSGGGTPEVISTRELEDTLSGKVIEGGFSFMDRGHRFYAVRVRDNPTWCFDLTTGLWSERARGVSLSNWSGCCTAMKAGVEFFGTSTGKVAVLDRDVFTDDGEVIVAEAVSIPVVRGGKEFSVGRAHININSGHKDIGREPRIMLQTSKDGHTWGRERWRNMGRRGAFFKEIRWHGLGQFKRFQVRLRITDEVTRDIYGASYE